MTAGHAQCGLEPRPPSANPRVRLFAGAAGLAGEGWGEGSVRLNCERRDQLGTFPLIPPRPCASLRSETCLLKLPVGCREPEREGQRDVPKLPRHSSRGSFWKVRSYSCRVFAPRTEAVFVRWATARGTSRDRRGRALKTPRARAGGGAGGGRAASATPPAASETRCGYRQPERCPRE